MRRILLMAGVLALAACSGVQANVITSTSASPDPTQQLAQFVVTDLQAADQIAKSAGDTVGDTCYSYLIPKVQKLQAASTNNSSVAGAASFAEVQRGTVAQINDLKSGLNVACAPLVLDTASTLTQLGVKLGAVATTVASGGVALPSVLP